MNNINKKEIPLNKGLFTGISVISEMLLGGIFLENIKIEKQRTSLPYPIIYRNILKNGIYGFYAGFIPWGFALGFGKGFVLGSSKTKITNICKKYNIDNNYTNIISGFGAGAFQGMYNSPLALAKTRINKNMNTQIIKLNFINHIKYSSSILNSSIKNEGFKVLLSGMPQMMLKRSLDWGTRFYFIDKIQLYFKNNNDHLTDKHIIASSFIGGSLSVLLTMPIDRLLPVIQSNTSNKNISCIIKNKIKDEGIITLFRGWRIRTLQTGWHTTFAIFIADKLYNLYN